MFSNPYMLLGLAVAALPIIVHLLSRARYRSVDWGGMMFLEGAFNSQSRSRRPNQWILLLVRAGMVACLAVALARPELRGKFSGASSAASARRGVAVILLDCSASMSFDENGRSRMELARDAAKQLLSLHRGDRVGLVLMGQSQSHLERAPTADLWDVGRRIESAEVGFGRTDVGRSLEDALDAIESREAPSGADAGPLPVTFYIVSDRQAANWAGMLDPSSDWLNAWHRRLVKASAAARLLAVPVGSADGENVILKSIEPVTSPTIAGFPLEVEIAVQNVGPVQWAALPMTVTVDRRTLPEVKLNLSPDSTSTVRVSVPASWLEAGTHVISAELNKSVSTSPGSVTQPRPGGLLGDDRLDAVIDILEPTRVLIITGEEYADSSQVKSAGKASGDKTADVVEPSRSHSSDYLAAALLPFKLSKKKQADGFVVETTHVEKWTGGSLTAWPVVPASGKPGGKLTDAGASRELRPGLYQVVILANIERLTDEQAASLDQFVYEGGGLLFIPGDLTLPEAFDTGLYRDGAGVLPAALGQPTSADWSDQTSLLGFDATHPAMKFLAGRPDSLLSITVGRYFPVDKLASGSRSLVRLATGEPFLIEAPTSAARRGRVVLMTTSPASDWTTLASSNFFLPLVQSTVRYLGESSARRLNLQPGEPIDIPFEEQVEGRTVKVRPPDTTDDRPADFIRPASQLLARYTDTEAPGIYQVKVNEPGKRTQVISVAVTPGREESNLQPLTDADWDKLEKSAEVQKLDPAQKPISAATALPAPLELWPMALAGVLLLALLEMKLSRAWGRTEVE